MILDISQFTGPINIEGIHDGSVTSLATIEDLEVFIKLHETRYIKKILGPVSELFLSYLNERTEEERWNNLEDRLSEECGSLARYVFFYYTRAKGGVSTPTGVKSESKSPYSICVQTWNEMVFQNKELYEMLSEGDYEGFEFDNSLLRMIL